MKPQFPSQTTVLYLNQLNENIFQHPGLSHRREEPYKDDDVTRPTHQLQVTQRKKRLLPPRKKNPSIALSRNRYRAILALYSSTRSSQESTASESRGREFVYILLMPVPWLLLTYCEDCTAPRNHRCIRERFCVSLLECNTTPFHHTHTPTSNIPLG